MAKKTSHKKVSGTRKSDDFKSVAKRLDCDPDLDRFDAKLRKIAKAKPKAKK